MITMGTYLLIIGFNSNSEAYAPNVSSVQVETRKVTNITSTVLTASPASTAKNEIITMTSLNTVVMDQAFSDQSVQVVMRDLQRVSDKLSSNSVIYLFMNSPGGSISAGLQLISFAKALPQKVKTITLFSASMAFQTVQQLDERLLLENGTLMSHQASFGIEGSTRQVHSRLKWIMQMVDGLDIAAAKRMFLRHEAYQELIRDEYWTYDQNAIKDKAADRLVLVKCGDGLKGTKTVRVDTVFGQIDVVLPACPIIPGYISVTPVNASVSKNAVSYVQMMFENRRDFTNEYITNNKFQDYQK